MLNKIGYLFIMILCISFSAEAREKVKLTWEDIHLKCLNFSEEKKIKNKNICEKAEKIVREKEEQEKYPFMSVRFFSDYSFTSYEVKDTQTGASASLVSSSHIKTDLRLVQHYASGLKTYFGLGHQNLIFENSLSKPLVNDQLKLWNYMGGVIFNPLERLSLDISIHYGDVFYVRSQGENNLKFSQHLTPMGLVKSQFDLFSNGNLDFGVAGHLGIMPSFNAKNRDEVEGNFKAKTSLNYGGEFFARKQFEAWSLAGNVGFNQRQMDTSISEGRLNEVTIGFKIAVPFGFNEDN